MVGRARVDDLELLADALGTKNDLVNYCLKLMMAGGGMNSDIFVGRNSFKDVSSPEGQASSTRAGPATRRQQPTGPNFLTLQLGHAVVSFPSLPTHLKIGCWDAGASVRGGRRAKEGQHDSAYK